MILQALHLVRHKARDDDGQNQGLDDDCGRDEAMRVVVSHTANRSRGIEHYSSLKDVACRVDVESVKSRQAQELRTT